MELEIRILVVPSPWSKRVCSVRPDNRNTSTPSFQSTSLRDVHGRALVGAGLGRGRRRNRRHLMTGFAINAKSI